MNFSFFSRFPIFVVIDFRAFFSIHLFSGADAMAVQPFFVRFTKRKPVTDRSLIINLLCGAVEAKTIPACLYSVHTDWGQTHIHCILK